MRLGFHVSIAGGLARAFERAESLGCETMQVFTSNPRGWRVAVLNQDDVEEFRVRMRHSDVSPVFAHMPYLANLASSGEQAERSRRMLREQLRRCDKLGIRYLIAHVGKAMTTPEERALQNVAANVNAVIAESLGSTILLLENTAGMGSEIGYSFAQIAAIIGMLAAGDRIGFCLDTAHAFAAGYDWRTRPGTDEVLKELDATIGIGRLYVIHLNDSKS
ncbi:MAG: deoxyribonuclease IV, partial [candidate division WOR-3 bacterium]